MVARASSSTVVSVVVAKVERDDAGGGDGAEDPDEHGARADARHLMAPGRNLLEDDRGGAS